MHAHGVDCCQRHALQQFPLLPVPVLWPFKLDSSRVETVKKPRTQPALNPKT